MKDQTRLEYRINLFSVVVIGAFNPAILTPEFLEGQCGYKSNAKPIGRSIPFATQLEWGKLEFTADFQRFQIVERGLSDYSDQSILSLASKYLSVLEHTPLSLIGLNFNSELPSDVVARSVRAVSDTQEDILDVTNAKPTRYSISVEGNEDGTKKYTSCEIEWDNVYDGKIRTKIERADSDSSVINVNYEIDGLNKSRGRLHLVETNLADAINAHDSIARVLLDDAR